MLQQLIQRRCTPNSMPHVPCPMSHALPYIEDTFNGTSNGLVCETGVMDLRMDSCMHFPLGGTSS